MSYLRAITYTIVILLLLIGLIVVTTVQINNSGEFIVGLIRLLLGFLFTIITLIGIWHKAIDNND